MNRYATRSGAVFGHRLFFIAGLLLAASVAGCGPDAVTRSDARPQKSAASSALRSMPAGGAEDRVPLAIEPGTYLIQRSAWSVNDFSVTFPAGWTVQYGHVYAQHTDESDEFGFYAVVVDDIYADACRGETAALRPVGPRSTDLVQALLAQPGVEATGPVATTLDGRPATRVDLEVPRGADVTACSLGGLGLQIWYSSPADKYFVLLPHATASVYIVEVAGKRQVFLTQTGDPASAADRAELQSVLDSIRLR
jgi:hypothetical protein